MLSHQNLTANIRQSMALDLADERAVALDFLPFYHMYGMTVLNCGLAIGVTQIILPRFDPELILHLVGEHGVTDLYLVPPALMALMNHPRIAAANTSTLRFVLSAAAPLAAEVAREGEARFGCAVVEGYGMTETVSIVNVSPLEAPRPRSVGPPVPDTVEKIVADGEEAKPGEMGELFIKGPQVMLGYWNRPEATAGAFTEDGFLRTGDIASADADGFVRIHDRLKEMIKYKGYQVIPSELEAVLLERPSVRDAAVIPKPVAEGGEAPKAYVVLRDPLADLEQIVAFVAERLAPYKRIRFIEAAEHIPRALSGKILRRELIERERARDEHVHTAP